jgi:hypothetical protein
MRIASVLFLLLAVGGFAYAFVKVAIINGPFMIIVGISTFLTLMSGICAGVGSGRASLFDARATIKELTEKVAMLGDANDGMKASFENKLQEAMKAFKEGYKAGPAPTNGAGNVANA